MKSKLCTLPLCVQNFAQKFPEKPFLDGGTIARFAKVFTRESMKVSSLYRYELPEWPASPWNIAGRRLTQNRWATDEDVEVYKQAFSNPEEDKTLSVKRLFFARPGPLRICIQ